MNEEKKRWGWEKDEDEKDEDEWKDERWIKREVKKQIEHRSIFIYMWWNHQ